MELDRFVGIYDEETSTFYLSLWLLIKNFPLIDGDFIKVEQKKQGSFAFHIPDHESLQFEMSIKGKSLYFNNFESPFLNPDDCSLEMAFDFVENIDLDCIKVITSIFSNKKQLKIDIHLAAKFEINPENLPTPSEFGKSLLGILNHPNEELLNDWLFCHNHSHTNSLIESPQVLPSKGLNRIEQILHLLNTEAEQILFESIEDKNQSIYINLIRRNIYLTYNVNDCLMDGEKSLNKNERVFPELRNCCMVKYEIFEKNEIDKNRCNDVGQSIAEKRVKLLKYRMSFEVDWYQVEVDLFNFLINLLRTNSMFMEKLLANKFSKDLEKIYNDHQMPSIKDLKINNNLSFLESFCLSS